MENILEPIQYVVEHSRYVKINHKRLFDFANNFRYESVEHWLGSAPFDVLRLSDRQKLHSIFIFNALSFSYWGEPKWVIEYRGQKYDGAYGMIAALDRAFQNGVLILDFQYCKNIDDEQFAKIFEGNTEIPLLSERANILREISSVMVEKFQGDPGIVLENADGDAQKLLSILLENFPSFRDEANYDRKTIRFQKRAQLLIADIFQMFRGDGYGSFRNIATLTACADYKLPQILRKLGILEYSEVLAKKIDDMQEITAGSTEEIELRANTIWAVDLITKEIQKTHPDILTIEVNDWLWLATQEKYPHDKPYHRTRTTAY